ncbi:CHASE4 domain-containing protein [Solidesulfovibrio alcoholivorans]|uniref:CHASE4 domain-containing protein n=1 Tax=Solidesulfovibrio alcoholivorans TaxID=81406 RepID=UPI0004968C37|nr:CHASE4 domain-containing protein [Solidesulfovibrio alcoholivorans]
MRASIRKFTLLGICLGSVLLFASYISINSYLLDRAFTDFEYASLMTDVLRATNTVHEEAHKLDETVVDWAVWDDSAMFMQGKTKDYIESNLNERTIERLSLYFIAFIDNKGNIVWSNTNTGENKYTFELPQDIKNAIFKDSKILTESSINNRVHGIALLDKGLAIIASCPIHTSDGEGPQQGMLVMGRLFSPGMMQNLSEKIQIPFHVEPDSMTLPHRIARADKKTFHTKAQEVVTIFDIGENETAAVTLLRDLANRKQLRLIVYGNKDIVHAGIAMNKRAAVYLAVGGLLLLAAIVFLVEKRILRRLLRITSQITQIKQQNTVGDCMPHISVSGTDEITTMANQINSFIDEINHYKTDLENLVLERTNDLNNEIIKKEHIQQQLESAKDAAEQANRMKTDFLAKVTHEIRTPMNAIKGLNDYLLHTSLNEEQKECASIIKDSSLHLLDIVNDLLDLSRIEAGKLTLERIDFNLSDLITATVKILRPIAARKKLEIHIDYTGDAGIVCSGDPSRIRQILFNLTHNAIKFTQLGEIRIAVRVDKVEIAGLYAVSIAVKDSGIGIETSQLANIFEPFTQSDNSMSRKYGGTGLGLAICKQLVELMGGSISVVSVPGVGSEFSVALRLPKGRGCDDGAQAPSARDTAPDRHGALRILVVDDTPTNLMVAEKMFSMLGQRPTLAASGEQALALLQQEHFDVVFLDIEMPGMNGFELAKSIRGGVAPLNRQTRLIAMTAYTLDSVKQQCFQAGMEDFLAKPIDLESLAAKLQPLGSHAVIVCSQPEDAALAQAQALAGADDRDVLDVEAGMARLGMDRQLYEDVCDGFLEKFNADKFEIVFLRHAPEPKELLVFVHTLKGIARQLGAERIAAFAETLETALHQGNAVNLTASLMTLGREIRAVEDAIARFRQAGENASA